MVEFLSNFYWLLLPQTVAEAFYYANWKKARKRGILALLWECMQSLLLLNVWGFTLPKQGQWRPGDVETLLKQYGVPMFGLVYDGDGCTFYVPKHKARWAYRIMNTAGVPLI